MAFPTIPTVAAGRVLTGVQADTTATRTFPSLSGLTKNSGDLLIAIVVAYQGSLTSNIWSSWGGGFTEVKDIGVATQHNVGIAYKWSTGSETGTFSATQAATITGHAAFILLSIPGAHATTPPEVSAALATGTSAAADPAALDPAGWAAEDTLWIAVRGSGETSTTGSFTGLGAAPTNYTDSAQTGISADAVGGVEAGTSFRQLNASSEDVPAGTTDTSNARNMAIVIAVRPPVVVDTLVTPGVASLTTATFAPTVTATANQLVTPGVAALTATTFAPTVLTPTVVTPGIATLALTGFAPTVTASSGSSPTVTPGTASLAATTFAPTVTATAHVTVIPAIATLSLASFAPTVLTPRLVTPGIATLSLTGFAPTVLTPRLVTPGIATLALSGFAPTVLTPRVVIPGVGSLTLIGLAPTVLTPRVVTPGVGTLALTGFAPTALATDNITVTPGLRTLGLTLFAPSVQVAAAVISLPGSVGARYYLRDSVGIGTPITRDSSGALLSLRGSVGVGTPVTRDSCGARAYLRDTV